MVGDFTVNGNKMARTLHCPDQTGLGGSTQGFPRAGQRPDARDHASHASSGEKQGGKQVKVKNNDGQVTLQGSFPPFTSEGRGVLGPNSNVCVGRMILGHQLDGLQVNAVLTLSTRRQHPIPQVRGSVPQDTRSSPPTSDAGDKSRLLPVLLTIRGSHGPLLKLD